MKRTWIHRFGAEMCLAASGVCILAIYIVLHPITDQALALKEYATVPTPDESRSMVFGILAARTVQLSMLLLEVLVAVLALGIVAQGIGPQMRPRIIGCRACLVCVAALLGGVVWRAKAAWDFVKCGQEVEGFLGRILAPVVCNAQERGTLALTKGFGEVSGIVLAVAAATLVAFDSRPSRAELARRYIWFQRLLYVSSFLFVVGTLVSRANFTWVVAHWYLPTNELKEAAAAVVTAGTIQVSVAYSAMLAAAFVPLRLLLDVHLNAHVPKPEQKVWFDSFGVSPTWQNDARQILGLLAPVLAAPIFDAVAKL